MSIVMERSSAKGAGVRLGFDTLEQRRAAIDRVLEELRRLGAEEGNEIHVYGSVAKGRIHAASDVDVLYDAPEGKLMEVFGRIEDIGYAHGVPIDVKPLVWCTPEFRDRVSSHSWTFT